MGLKIGLSVGSLQETEGGAWTFSKLLSDALVKYGRPHVFFDLDECTEDQKKESLETRSHAEAIDAVWFMYPIAQPVRVPYIATIWDLEHRKQPYFPELNSSGFTWTDRETIFADLLPRAAMIVTGTEVGKEEIVHYYRVNPANIVVLPFPAPPAIPSTALDTQTQVKNKYGIVDRFLFYPAQLWPHKNHYNLLHALRILRDKYNLNFSLVLTGANRGNYGHIESTARDLDLWDRIFLLGFIPRDDLTALYRTADALVFPSFFGPDNFPPLEAFSLGCPVAAANIAGAREQLGDAALLFDPHAPLDIAAKVATIVQSPRLREKLIKRGFKLASERTPQAYVETLCGALDRFETMRRCWGTYYYHM